MTIMTTTPASSLEPMTFKLDMWHQVLEYCQDCPSGLGLTLTYSKVRYGKMLEHKISCKDLKILLIQWGSNGDFRLTLSLLFGLL